MDCLPKELILKITENLNISSVIMLSLVSRKYMIPVKVTNLLLQAAKDNHTNAFIFWKQTFVSKNASLYAAEHGNLDILKIMTFEEQDIYQLLVSKIAAYHGHLQIIKWIISSGWYWNSDYGNDTPITQQYNIYHLIPKKFKVYLYGYADDIFSLTILGRQQHIFDFFLEICRKTVHKFKYNCLTAAFATGDKKVIDYFQNDLEEDENMSIILSNRCMYQAVQYGQLDLVKQYGNDAFKENYLQAAFRGDHREIIEYIMDKYWDQEKCLISCYEISHMKHNTILWFYHKYRHKIILTETTKRDIILIISRQGTLDVLKWALDEFEINIEVETDFQFQILDYAICGDRVEIANYILTKLLYNYSNFEETKESFDHYILIRLPSHRAYAFSDICQIDFRSLEMFKLFHENFHLRLSENIYNLIHNKNENLLKYLVNHHCEHCKMKIDVEKFYYASISLKMIRFMYHITKVRPVWTEDHLFDDICLNLKIFSYRINKVNTSHEIKKKLFKKIINLNPMCRSCIDKISYIKVLVESGFVIDDKLYKYAINKCNDYQFLLKKFMTNNNIQY